MSAQGAASVSPATRGAAQATRAPRLPLVSVFVLDVKSSIDYNIITCIDIFPVLPIIILSVNICFNIVS